jgi:hypothetical protein
VVLTIKPAYCCFHRVQTSEIRSRPLRCCEHYNNVLVGIYDDAIESCVKIESCYMIIFYTLHFKLDVREMTSEKFNAGQTLTRKLHQQAKHQTAVVEASHLQAAVNNAKAPSLPFHPMGARLARRCRCGRLTASQALEVHLRTSGSCRYFQSFGARCRPSPRRPSRTWALSFEFR